MKKLILGLSLLTTMLLISCSKDENVSKDYVYTLDEEFLDNDLGWNLFDGDDAYSAKINSNENGLLELIATKKTYNDLMEGGADLDGDFSLQSTFTLVRDGGTSKTFTGVSWDNIDIDNYMLFSINQVDEDVKYLISEITNGINPEKNILFEGEVIAPSPSVYALEITRSDTTLAFIVNGVVVKEIKANTLSSSKVGVFTRGNDANFHNIRVGKL